jgi:hypothetical protein
MYKDLEGYMTECYHGFVMGRSSVLNLLEYSTFVLNSIESGCQVDSIYKDLLPVHVFKDCLKIQSDLNKLVEWWRANALELNVGKCKSITFLTLGHPFEFSYVWGRIILDRIDSISDLRVIIGSKISFAEHIDVAVGKALALLAFVKNISSDSYTFKTLILFTCAPEVETRKFCVKVFLWSVCQ